MTFGTEHLWMEADQSFEDVRLGAWVYASPEWCYIEFAFLFWSVSLHVG